MIHLTVSVSWLELSFLLSQTLLIKMFFSCDLLSWTFTKLFILRTVIASFSYSLSSLSVEISFFNNFSLKVIFFLHFGNFILKFCFRLKGNHARVSIWWCSAFSNLMIFSSKYLLQFCKLMIFPCYELSNLVIFPCYELTNLVIFPCYELSNLVIFPCYELSNLVIFPCYELSNLVIFPCYELSS